MELETYSVTIRFEWLIQTPDMISPLVNDYYWPQFKYIQSPT